MCSRNTDQTTVQNQQGNPSTPTVPDLNDAKALDEKYGIAAVVHCSSEADDYLRSITKYDFKWDETGFLEHKFDKYLLHVVSPGVLTSTSTKAKLQNGFGAYQRIEILCDYDTQTEKVLRYRVAVGTR